MQVVDGSVGGIQRRPQVREHVVDGDGLRERVDPARAEHHGQPLDQRLNHLEREAPGPNHDRGAELDDGNTALAKDVTGVRTALTAGNRLTVKNATQGYTFEAQFDLSPRQIDILLAGGQLNYTKAAAK